ncbi:MAG: ERCC4 domain-containing protein [Romboutsia sp.]
MNFEYKILVDTREKDHQHIVDKLVTNNIEVERKALIIGDYRIQSETYVAPITIERKGSLDELIGNLLDKDKDNEGNNRFIRELNRARDSKTRFILLIEDKNFYYKICKGEYISRVHPRAIKGMIMSLEAKYPNLSIVGISKGESASYIHTTLYYHLRQKLKEVEQYG